MTRERMKVLHVASSIDLRDGGVAMALIGLASAQQLNGCDVTVVATQTSDIDDTGTGMLRKAQVQVEVIGPVQGSLRRHPQMFSTLTRLIANVQIVHIHGLWQEIEHQAAYISRQQRKPYLISPHGMLDPWCLSQSRLRKKAYMLWRQRKDLDAARALHFTTPTELELVSPLKLQPETIVETNGLDLSEFELLPGKEEFRDRFPLVGGRRIVLFLSRLHHKKGLELLIPAFALCHQPEMVLVLAGPCDESYLLQLKSLTRQHGVENQVVFTGMLHGRERIAALVAAELFVLPSYQENFGLVVAESLAAGTAVVISDQVNIHEQISAAGVGGVVPLRIEAIAAEIGRWMGDDELRREAAARARPFARAHYDWREIGARWAAHYARLVASP